MFVWPPKSQQKQDFQEPCVALYTYTYANGRSRPLLVYGVLSHVQDLPAPLLCPEPSPQSMKLTACAPNQPSPVNTTYLDRTLSTGFSSDKENLHVGKIFFVFPARGPLKITNIKGMRV